MSAKFLICRFQGVMIPVNVKLSRKFLINFSAIASTKL